MDAISKLLGAEASEADLRQFGAMIGAGILDAQVNKETSITPGTPNVYGRYTMFDVCSPGDVFGLQVQTHGLMKWLGTRKNKFYKRHVDFIRAQVFKAWFFDA